MSDYALPINVGNPDELTMLKLAEEIIHLTKSKSEVVFKELPTDDPKVRQPNISKAREILGWEPKVNRTEGLARTIEYFRKKLKIS